MFFILSKIFWTLAQPLNAICLLLVMGGFVRVVFSDKGGKVMIRSAIALFLIFGLLPVGPALMVWLERQYPTPHILPEKIDGIMVLGGAFESYLTKENGQLAANDNIDRMLCFSELAKEYADAKLVYSGGAGDILNPDAYEGDDAKIYFDITNLNREVLYEEKSRNTYENILYTKEMVQPKSGQNWIVVTSAYHMPRTMAIFEKQDWKVISYACDRRTEGSYSKLLYRLPSVTTNYVMLNLALREMIGGIIYYFSGKSAFIAPFARVA